MKALTPDEHSFRKDWTNIFFLTLTPVIGVFGTAFVTWKIGFAWWMPALLLGMYLLVGLSICAGYHRFFSHKSYQCRPAVQALFAFFGGMAAQNSILTWSAGHRMHHKYVDRDWDPYNIRRGFWWAHILWVFYKSPDEPTFDNVRDLQNNRIVQWQHRWIKPLLIVGGFGIPTAVGALFGHPVAGLLWGGFTRIVLVHHTTFFVNSLAHNWGNPKYDAEISARDNWVVALLTLGEGYHSFHHRFPADFRNSTRWHQWDPAKWLIFLLSLTGFASKLKTTSVPMVEQARMQAAVRKMETRIEKVSPHYGEEIRRRIAAAGENLEYAFELWRLHLRERAEGLSNAWRRTRRSSRRQLKLARWQWNGALRLLEESLKAA